MDKAYAPDLHDNKWQSFWEKHKLSQPEISEKKHKNPTSKSFTIVMPPPNVTGVLHQGHALTMALEDALIRWHRMLGDSALYLPGSDHAAIAVQMQVVKFLESKSINYLELGREKFLDECWKWIAEYQPRIFKQIKALGASCDWTRVKFTLDPALNKAVEHAFLELYKKGLIYRAERLVNWTPKGQTGLSDLEVTYEDRESQLWHLRYPIDGDSSKYLVVATTRPETMLGDTAVAVHPDDERYKSLIGKNVRLPIVDRLIPIIADTFVDKDFGSGCVKITPAHDHNDFECGLRHNLPRLNILNKEGKIVKNLPSKGAELAGLDRFVARKKIIEIFEQSKLLEKIEKHKNRVGISERFGDVVEPYLSQQWFVKIDTLASKALKAVVDGDIRIIPQEFNNQYQRWMEGIHDWCISRQLWWGHPIPAFHCAKCSHVEVAASKPSLCSKCGHNVIENDPDVLDTWFSSGLWPFSTLGWPENTSDMKKYYPTQILETGFDILFFWVARMIMMGIEFTGKAPFSEVYLHPMVRDAQGQKMSKTKGNVIDPLEIVQQYGADTLRLTLHMLCVQGRDLNFSMDRMEGYRNFINKIWNAVKFVTMGEAANDWRGRPKPSTLHDRWILTRLDATARDVNEAWSNFKMAEASEKIYHFVWNDFCDWYLECVKATRQESQKVLTYVTSEMLKLLHPICPHVTEELWHQLPGVNAEESLMVEDFPRGDAFPDAGSIAEFRFVQSLVNDLRTLKSENGVKPSKKINVYCSLAEKKSLAVIQNYSMVIESLLRLEKLHMNAQNIPEKCTKVVVLSLDAGTNVEFFVPVSELVDLEEERNRLQKEVQQLEKLHLAQKAKLSNEKFVSGAPFEIVEKERIKLKEIQDKLLKTEESIKKLG